MPSCGAELADKSCVDAPGADAGAITVGDSAVGSEACAGTTFAVAISDPASGKLSFTPSAPVVLDTLAASRCVVGFSYAVNFMPTKDSSADAGTQTELVAFANSNAKGGADVGYATVTVVRDTPQLTLQASPAVVSGGTISATATLTGAAGPEGSITFDLFSPSDPGCSGTPMASSSVPVAGNGTYTSAAVVVSLPGNYHWTSSYGGDADNAPRRLRLQRADGGGLCRPAAAAVARRRQRAAAQRAPPAASAIAAGGAGSSAQTAGLRLGGFKLTPKMFTRGSVKGTRISYWLSGPGGVRFVIERATPGRRANATCVKPSAKLEQSARCTRYVKVTTIERTYKSAGSRILRFSGRLNRRALPVGSYRVRATPSAVPGGTAAGRAVGDVPDPRALTPALSRPLSRPGPVLIATRAARTRSPARSRRRAPSRAARPTRGGSVRRSAGTLISRISVSRPPGVMMNSIRQPFSPTDVAVRDADAGRTRNRRRGLRSSRRRPRR